MSPTSHHKSRLLLLVVGCVVASVSGVSAAVALGGDSGSDGPAGPRPAALTNVDNAVGTEIFGTDRVSVMGPDGVAGWVYLADLNHNTTEADFADIDALNERLRNWASPVHDESGAVIGYWVTNGVGFVDLATYNSPSYDPDQLRQERLSPDHRDLMQGGT